MLLHRETGLGGNRTQKDRVGAQSRQAMRERVSRQPGLDSYFGPNISDGGEGLS